MKRRLYRRHLKGQRRTTLGQLRKKRSRGSVGWLDGIGQISSATWHTVHLSIFKISPKASLLNKTCLMSGRDGDCMRGTGQRMLLGPDQFVALPWGNESLKETFYK